MKYIIAIIQPDRLDEVLQLLTEKEIHLVTVSNVLGRGRQKGIAEVYRSHKEAGSLLKKVKIEIAVNEAFVTADDRSHHEGRPHRPDRRRQDLRAGSAGMYSHPHRRNRRRCDRITNGTIGRRSS